MFQLPLKMPACRDVGDVDLNDLDVDLTSYLNSRRPLSPDLTIWLHKHDFIEKNVFIIMLKIPQKLPLKSGRARCSIWVSRGCRRGRSAAGEVPPPGGLSCTYSHPMTAVSVTILTC
jgi:hypothetical protein